NEELEQIIENDKTGFLCEDAQEWQRKLVLLVENIDLRMKIGKEAKRKVLSDCMTYTAERPAVNAVIKKRNE
ncbi:MAG: glycosyltransferase, partial [Christensenellaceae bacterium]